MAAAVGGWLLLLLLLLQQPLAVCRGPHRFSWRRLVLATEHKRLLLLLLLLSLRAWQRVRQHHSTALH